MIPVEKMIILGDENIELLTTSEKEVYTKLKREEILKKHEKTKEIKEESKDNRELLQEDTN